MMSTNLTKEAVPLSTRVILTFNLLFQSVDEAKVALGSVAKADRSAGRRAADTDDSSIVSEFVAVGGPAAANATGGIDFVNAKVVQLIFTKSFYGIFLEWLYRNITNVLAGSVAIMVIFVFISCLKSCLDSVITKDKLKKRAEALKAAADRKEDRRLSVKAARRRRAARLLTLFLQAARLFLEKGQEAAALREALNKVGDAIGVVEDDDVSSPHLPPSVRLERAPVSPLPAVSHKLQPLSPQLAFPILIRGPASISPPLSPPEDDREVEERAFRGLDGAAVDVLRPPTTGDDPRLLTQGRFATQDDTLDEIVVTTTSLEITALPAYIPDSSGSPFEAPIAALTGPSGYGASLPLSSPVGWGASLDFFPKERLHVHRPIIKRPVGVLGRSGQMATTFSPSALPQPQQEQLVNIQTSSSMLPTYRPMLARSLPSLRPESLQNLRRLPVALLPQYNKSSSSPSQQYNEPLPSPHYKESSLSSLSPRLLPSKGGSSTANVIASTSRVGRGGDDSILVHPDMPVYRDKKGPTKPQSQSGTLY